ncbi:hypothetical protein [Hyphomicrobium sp. ghe19]|uniref:hypothetical protein n=1 Tax=Hyphomicrobium sp. ghe19 TaxID=2682968 RepID=UPI001366CEF4|nr:hypothetical protein HYPP_02612 [Hyphomicrobium sp. ghe19]
MTREEEKLTKKLQKLLEKRFHLEKQITAVKFKLGKASTKADDQPLWKNFL